MHFILPFVFKRFSVQLELLQRRESATGLPDKAQ